MNNFPRDKGLAQGRNYYGGFGFCSCSWKQKNIHFRLINACDATLVKYKRPKKNFPTILDSGWTPPPLLDNV